MFKGAAGVRGEEGLWQEAEQLSLMLEALLGERKTRMSRFRVQQLRSEWKEDTGKPISDQNGETHSDVQNCPKCLMRR